MSLATPAHDPDPLLEPAPSGTRAVAYAAPAEPTGRGSRPRPFADTLLALEVEQRRHRLRGVGVLISIIAVAWAVWAFAAEVQVYALTGSARIEGRGIHPLVALDAGRVVESRLELGRAVQAGEVLAQLDDTVESRQLEAERARHAAFRPQIEALRAELEREEAAAEAEQRAAEASQVAARSRLRQARRALVFARERSNRFRRSLPAAAELEVLDSAAEVDSKSSQLAATAAEAEQVGHELRGRASAREAQRERLRQELAELEGLERTSAVTLELAERRLERRGVRASHAGVIVETSGVLVGQMLQPGERLATLMSGSSLQVIGEFPPGDAVGRIQPGQAGTLRLDGFPWAQYGTVSCRVSRVAAEPTNGAVRVELALSEPELSAIPLQHGLVGTLEIAVSRLSPAELFVIMLGEGVRSSRTGTEPPP